MAAAAPGEVRRCLAECEAADPGEQSGSRGSWRGAASLAERDGGGFMAWSGDVWWSATAVAP